MCLSSPPCTTNLMVSLCVCVCDSEELSWSPGLADLKPQQSLHCNPDECIGNTTLLLYLNRVVFVI
ncbi:hypothetical protein B296_00046941 [Ensete ventricosum]|uniref:Uncharacterized protein n=1 Tax=Ensete ventricosum TaxID=4639 RepID=A0A426Z1S5_ENSVE|nr:hypothetical protein B296_00046941 [Ensete ventricosum]